MYFNSIVIISPFFVISTSNVVLAGLQKVNLLDETLSFCFFVYVSFLSPVDQVQSMTSETSSVIGFVGRGKVSFPPAMKVELLPLPILTVSKESWLVYNELITFLT